MAFKDVPKGSAIDIKKEKIGWQCMGTLTGHKIITTPFGENTVWQFIDDENKPFEIFGFANLNFNMEKVSPDTLCRITYNGKSSVKNKFGKFPHLVRVEIDVPESDEEKEEISF